MAVTVQSFKNAFSEFRKADSSEVEAKIGFAQQRITATVWGDKYDQGVMYLTAHLLSVAPAGQNTKLKPENAAKTVYWQEYERLRNSVVHGIRTAGLPPGNAFADPVHGE